MAPTLSPTLPLFAKDLGLVDAIGPARKKIFTIAWGTVAAFSAALIIVVLMVVITVCFCCKKHRNRVTVTSEEN